MWVYPVNAKPNRCSACLLKPIAVLYVIPYITTVLMLISMIYCALISYNQVPVERSGGSPHNVWPSHNVCHSPLPAYDAILAIMVAVLL